MSLQLPPSISDQVARALTAYEKLFVSCHEPLLVTDSWTAKQLLAQACTEASAHISKLTLSGDSSIEWGRLVSALVRAMRSVQAWEETATNRIVEHIAGSMKELKLLHSVSELQRRGCSEMARIISAGPVLFSIARDRDIEPVALHRGNLDARSGGQSFHAAEFSAESLAISSGVPVLTGQNGVAASAETTQLLLTSRQYIVPVWVGGRVIGVFHLADRDPCLGKVQKDGAKLFASCFATVMERLLLQNAQNHQLRSLYAIADDFFSQTAIIADEERGLLPQLGRPDTATETPPENLQEDVFKLLTPREREVLDLLLDGASNHGIASELVVSIDTVKTHVKNLLRKLGAKNRAQVIASYSLVGKRS